MPSAWLFTKSALVIFSLLWFHINCRIPFSISVKKKMHQNFDRDCIELIDSFSSVQSCLTLWDPMDCSTPGFLSITNSQNLLRLMPIKLVMPSNHVIFCHPLLLLPSIFPSIRVFSNESALCIRRPKYWSFSFSISPSNEYSGLISFSIDWFDLLSIQGTQESSIAPQIESINSSALSLLYGPTLTSVYDYWKDHSFDYTDICQQSDVSAF